MANLFSMKGISFTGTVLAGTGAVIQTSYTAPTGKRAIVESISLCIFNNAGAVNTIRAEAYLVLTGATPLVLLLENGGGGVIKALSESMAFDLISGQRLDIYSINTSVVNVFYVFGAVIKEFT